MPGGASKLRDIRKLAETRAAFDFDLPMTDLPGLPPELSAGGGRVQTQLRFGREQGFATAEVRLHAQLQVTCQRCMGPLSLAVDAKSPVVIVESEQEAEQAPAGMETFLAPDGRLSLSALVAEELLLALPIVPLHGTGTTCQPLGEAPVAGTQAALAGGAGAPATDGAAVVRPFADLRALLERGGKASK
jgi:DUF177 domain-containing protein